MVEIVIVIIILYLLTRFAASRRIHNTVSRWIKTSEPEIGRRFQRESEATRKRLQIMGEEARQRFKRN